MFNIGSIPGFLLPAIIGHSGGAGGDETGSLVSGVRFQVSGVRAQELKAEH